MRNTFVVAASVGIVSETAKQLRHSESTATYHIREVEKICRSQLFERQIRGLSLTRRGRAVLDISERLLVIAAELESPASRPTTVRSGKTAIRTGPLVISPRDKYVI